MSMIDISVTGFYILLVGISIVLAVVTFKYYKLWLRHAVEPILQPLVLISFAATILLIITIIGVINGVSYSFSFYFIQLMIMGAIVGLSSITMLMMNKWFKRMSMIKKKDDPTPSLILYLNLLGQTFKGESGYLTAYYLGRGMSEYVQTSKRSIKSIATLFSSLTGIMQIVPEDIREETAIIIDSKYINDKIIANMITYFAKGYWEGILTKIKGKDTRCTVRQNFTDNYFEIYLKPTKNNSEYINSSS